MGFYELVNTLILYG